MNALITYNQQSSPNHSAVSVQLPLSKSISNRVAMLNALADIETRPCDVARCDDTDVMLQALANTDPAAYINIGAAGTAMRFLTAYFASQPGRDITLDGSERMRQRPIGTLVDALRQAGANIEYTRRQGYPPLHITGCQLEGGSIEIDSSVSSQFISALLMVAPTMTLGMHLTLKGNTVSRPYIEMTLSLMRQYGAKISLSTPDAIDTEIVVKPSIYSQPYPPVQVEADWSAASYWYEIAALTGAEITLGKLYPNSLQGDACLQEIFSRLGVTTRFNNAYHTVTLTGGNAFSRQPFQANLEECPDLAQTIVATLCGLAIPFYITGLSTLPLKETNRLEALKTELAKLGFNLTVTGNDTISWDGTKSTPTHIATPLIQTYNDHRMAMAFAPLAAGSGSIVIQDLDVVTKSYPTFWDHLATAGFNISPFNDTEP